MIEESSTMASPDDVELRYDDKLTLEPTVRTSSRLAVEVPSAALSPESPVNVVPLFAQQVQIDSGLDELDTSTADWQGALHLIRDVSVQFRRERISTLELVNQSRLSMQSSIAQAEEAEKRSQEAEARASEACLLADRAEERVRLAEERAVQSEEKAQAAHAAEQEAQLWLRHLYASVRDEFENPIPNPS